ncbi:MAG: HAD-IIA family hydrolase [bacterium]|nr:HAD-IIA family hydrolase [bacterium]
MQSKLSFVIDMDGVIYHGFRPIEGAVEFISALLEREHRFLFLTNSSEKTPAELRQKLLSIGFPDTITEGHFYTSALATALFMKSQCPDGAPVYAIGEAGLYNALYSAGFHMSDINPEYVVVGETHSYNFEKISKATSLILGGAKFLATNPDLTGPTEKGPVPACGSLTAPIELATGVKPYYLGKPNPLMMRQAKSLLGTHSEQTMIIGDRMDTDIISGLEGGLRTCLVLSGVTSREEIEKFAFRPGMVLESVAEFEKLLN